MLHGFVDAGNTVVVIEHNLDVIKTADWVIDLGPEGGAGGGTIVAEGTPEEVAACAESYTGQALRASSAIQDPQRRKRKRAKRKQTSRLEHAAAWPELPNATPADDHRSALDRRARRAAAQPEEHRRRDPARIR